MILKIYGKETCKFCNIAKDYLDENEISYEYIDLKLKKNREARKLMSDLNVKHIPVFVYGDDYVEWSTKSENLFKEAIKRWLEKRGIWKKERKRNKIQNNKDS